MVMCNIMLLVTKEQQKIEYPRQPENSVAGSLQQDQGYETVKYGKVLPQIYDTNGTENGYYIAETSYCGSAESRVTVSFYSVVQQLPAARYH